MSMNEWWGYRHSNGSIQAKRWFGDELDLTEAAESPFVQRVSRPFQADNREQALELLESRV